MKQRPLEVIAAYLAVGVVATVLGLVWWQTFIFAITVIAAERFVRRAQP